MIRNFVKSNLRMGDRRDVALAAWLLIALGCGFVAYIARMHEVTHDAFHEMALVREAFENRAFPIRDSFAYTPTVDPLVHHEWATGAVLYFVTVGTGLGVAGLTVLKFLLAAGLWLMLYRVARLRGAHPYLFALFSFVVFPVLWVGFATVRAQQFTLLFIAIQLWMQELDWRGRRAWILLWLVMLVAWLNLHAGFVVGAGMIAFHSLERFGAAYLSQRSLKAAIHATWHLILAGPMAVLALRLNPYGWEYVPYLVRAIGMPRPEVREWHPLWATYMPGMTIATFLVSLAVFAYCLRHTRFRRSRGAIFLAICAYMAVKHIRHGSIYAIVWIATVPAWLSHTPLGRAVIASIDRRRRIAIPICQSLAVVCLTFACCHRFWLPTMPPQPVHSTACYPISAVEYLQENQFSGNLLTPFHVGSYVSWEMAPQVKVSLDGRYEVAYQEQVMPEHNRFFDAIGPWWEFLEKYPTDAVLVHVQAPVAKQLGLITSGSADEIPHLRERWSVVYQDDAFIIVAAERCGLPPVNRLGEALPDGARQAFSSTHAHWNRRKPPAMAAR